MKSLFYLFFVLVVSAQVCFEDLGATTIDFTSIGQSGKPLNELDCNAQTRIDFNFDQSASDDLAVTLSSGNYYTFDDSKGSHLQFLNRDGKELSYKLTGIAMNPYSNARVITNNIKTTPDYELSVTFSDQQNNQDNIVSVYILKSTSIVTDGDNNVIVQGQKTYSEINSAYNLIKSFTNVSESGVIKNIAGGLAYIQKPDLSQFYTVQTEPSSCGKKINFLVSGLVLKLTENLDLSNITATTTYTYTNNQASTGNKLCYGSHSTAGVFQTHMRESYPLWTIWFSTLLLWISILAGQSKTMSVYDKNYSQNRWTSWQLYSLWHIAHDQFFSRIMRSTAFFSSFWIICLVSSALYGFLDTSDLHVLTILYFGIAGCFAAFIYSFFSGIFLTGVSKWSLNKYIAKKNIKLLSDKQGTDALKHQLQIDQCEDKIYVYYYLFYVLTLFILIVCWTLSINFMQRPSRQYYYLMYYWIGSIGVGIGLYSLVLTPLWSLLAGNYAIAQIRGYWYDIRLGQTFREIEN